MSESWLDTLLYGQKKQSKEERDKEQIEYWKQKAQDG